MFGAKNQLCYCHAMKTNSVQGYVVMVQTIWVQCYFVIVHVLSIWVQGYAEMVQSIWVQSYVEIMQSTLINPANSKLSVLLDGNNCS